MFSTGFGGFSGPPLIFTLFFLVIIGVFIYVIAGGIRTWIKNNNSPKLTVEALVVSKREDVSSHHHTGDISGFHSRTDYYVTFEFESGDRQEFHISGSDYGMLAENDRGMLSFQGTRFLGFDRT